MRGANIQHTDPSTKGMHQPQIRFYMMGEGRRFYMMGTKLVWDLVEFGLDNEPLATQAELWTSLLVS